jgi:Tol biopolymer transport system component
MLASAAMPIRRVLPVLLLLVGCPKPETPTDIPPQADDPPLASEDDEFGDLDEGEDDDEDDGGFGSAPAMAANTIDPLPQEKHLGKLKMLTNGGENAEAYFSFDESRLVFQTTRDDMKCDQIFTMGIDGSNPTRISSGKGRTTCAYFLPGDDKVIYASTHAADDGCLPPPDRSLGYVWKLYDEYDIYRANADGSGVEPLITSKGYDAEATVSPKGDKIVFTSTRSGDPEIYTSDIDGKNIKRLTKTKGYDGGPFFNLDGTKIVYRANHPKGKEEKAKYDEMIKKGYVRPTRLELFVMDADGKNQKQITKNGKANFGPFWHPDGKRIIFASNMDAPKGRNFDLYIIGTNGEGLERITYNESFDGFPMFTRDGKTLVFSSNRNNAKEGDTNVFITEWKD